MRFVQGLAMFAATFTAGAATIAVTLVADTLSRQLDEGFGQVEWGHLGEGDVALLAVVATAVWGLLAGLAAVKRLSVWSAGLAGVMVGLGVVTFVLALARSFDGLTMVLAWEMPFPVAGALAGWAVWRWLEPRAARPI